MQNIQQYIKTFPFVQDPSAQQKFVNTKLVQELCQTTHGQLDNYTVEMYNDQLKILFATLNTSSKMAVLKDANHRALIITFIKQYGIQHYKYSYFNRAKLTQKHLEKLIEVGPILFSQAVMIASKLNTINKNSSRIFIQDHLYTESESPVDMKIQQILKLCDEKKRTINSNLKKLQLILDGPQYLQVIKQLGKMLRDSWKKDKSKIKCIDVVKEPVKRQHELVQFEQKNQQESISKNQQNIQQDRFSFTSSQKQIFKQQKQYVKIQGKKTELNVMHLWDFSDSSGGHQDYFDYQLSI